MADPLTIVATVLGVLGTGIGIASQLWPRTPPQPAPTPAPPRETQVPAAPSQPSVHDLDGAALRATVMEHGRRLDEHARKLDLVDTKGDEILLALARKEGAEEERRQRRADERAQRRGEGRGPSKSDG